MSNERDILVFLREGFQAFTNLLGAYGGILYSVWRMVPFFWTIREVQVWELRRNFGPRNSFVANRIVSLAQIRPDLYLDLVLSRGEGRENVHCSLYGTCHGRDDNEIWDGWDLNLLSVFVPCIRQGWVAVGVAAIDVMERLSVTDYVNARARCRFCSTVSVC